MYSENQKTAERKTTFRQYLSVFYGVYKANSFTTVVGDNINIIKTTFELNFDF